MQNSVFYTSPHKLIQNYHLVCTDLCHWGKGPDISQTERVLPWPSYLLHYHSSKPGASVKHQRPESCLFSGVQLSQRCVTLLSPISLSTPKSPLNSIHLSSQCPTSGKYWAGSRQLVENPHQDHTCQWVTTNIGLHL